MYIYMHVCNKSKCQKGKFMDGLDAARVLHVQRAAETLTCRLQICGCKIPQHQKDGSNVLKASE